MRLIYGAGLNDRTYPSKVNCKITKEYRAWSGMLQRCTEKLWCKYQAYRGTNCSENFKSYAFFYEWCHKQVGFGNIDEKGRKWQLDKDLLIKGNKVYSEDTCVFVPHRLNALLTKCKSSRGEYLLGVCFDRRYGNFIAQCNNGAGKFYAKMFKTEKEAFQAYKTFKENLIKQVANEYKDQLDPRAYQALMNYQVEETD